MPPPLPDDRRGFLAKAAALTCGVAACAVPAATGLVAFLDPLGRKSPRGQFLRVASLDMLPADGTPRQFPVLAERLDAWNRSPSVPVGAVFLRRRGADRVEALQAVCPHAGCYVAFDREKKDLYCPCHGARFELFGGRIAPAQSASPRDLDVLQTEVRGGGEVWVLFENFRTGTAQKVAAS